MSTASVRSYCPGTDLPPLVEALSRLRSTGVDYPPLVEADDTPESLGNWLDSEPDPIGRWVAEVDGTAIGHVLLSEPHDYLLAQVAAEPPRSPAPEGLAEIGKFFVAPDRHHLGVGEQLLQAARSCAWSRGFQPGLAVVLPAPGALRLYQKLGMRFHGEFEGIHGRNQVWVDPLP